MLNHWIGMGRLTADPEKVVTPNNVSVARFTIAIDRAYTGQNGEKQTDFLDIVAWRNTADFVAKYFTKGSMICVEGGVQKRSYEKDGQKRYITEIVAERVHFAGEKKEQNNTPLGTPDGFQEMNIDESDLPF